MKKVLYKLKQDIVYQEATLYQEVNIPPKTFVRIGKPGTYGWWYDVLDIIIQEFPENSNG